MTLHVSLTGNKNNSKFSHFSSIISHLVALYFVCFQVIKALGNPEFFNMVFPLLFDLCNSEPLKSGQAPMVSDPAESGYDKFWIFIYVLQQVFFRIGDSVWWSMNHLRQFLRLSFSYQVGLVWCWSNKQLRVLFLVWYWIDFFRDFSFRGHLVSLFFTFKSLYRKQWKKLFSCLLSLFPIQTSENRKQSENRKRFITSP